MTTIVEDALVFDFPEGWHASKYDKWKFYLRHFQDFCGGAKAVDIVAIGPDRCLWLIEIRDYRVGPREKPLDLAEELALKVRDSLAGLTAARLRSLIPAEIEMANRAAQCTELRVVLHLEQPVKPTRIHPVYDISLLIAKLKQLLRAVDFHPRVSGVADGNRFGWDVREV